MNTLKLLAIASSFLVVPALAAAEDNCTPRIVESPTSFPVRSQMRGQEGIVYVDVRIDHSGRAASAELRESSGYRLLDRAALQSIQSKWVFDVSDCVRKDLPATHQVAVDYRNTEY